MGRKFDELRKELRLKVRKSGEPACTKDRALRLDETLGRYVDISDKLQSDEAGATNGFLQLYETFARLRLIGAKQGLANGFLHRASSAWR